MSACGDLGNRILSPQDGPAGSHPCQTRKGALALVWGPSSLGASQPGSRLSVPLEATRWCRTLPPGYVTPKALILTHGYCFFHFLNIIKVSEGITHTHWDSPTLDAQRAEL